jgi:hypothetical protein
MATLKTLTLDRQGSFKVYTYGDSHCGTYTNGFLPLKYTLHCVCELTIDKRGFLFEQVGVDDFFQNLEKTKLSCEKFTINCTKRLVTLIHKDNPACRIRSIQLTLSPHPYVASMTYSVVPRD